MSFLCDTTVLFAASDAVAVGALVLLHNLYAGASDTSRQVLRWSAAALAGMWAYDLHLYTNSAEALSLTWDPSQEHLFRTLARTDHQGRHR